MNVDLNEIPEEFHPLFTCDYNNGVSSTMSSTDRSKLNDLFLKYNRYQIKKTLEKNELKSSNENNYDNMGFPKD